MLLRSVTNLLLASALACSAVFAQGPTYAAEVSRIVQAKCHICHRDGDIAPFSLNDYQDAVTWSKDIQAAVSNGIMPPWKPVPGYGEFRDSYALTDGEKQILLDWIANGMPFGNPRDLPPHVKDAGPWPLGTPDITLEVPKPFTPKGGVDVYRCFVLPDSGVTENTWLRAIDTRPGNRQIVHHVLIFQDTTGTAAKMDGQDGSPGYDCFGGPGIPIDYTNIYSALDELGSVAGWAPGTRTHFLPDGIGILLRPTARVVIQEHYYPRATTGPDQTSVGLYLANTTIQKRLYQIPVVNTTFTIPPNTVQNVAAIFPPVPLPLSAQAIEIFPHMHLLGTHILADLYDQNNNITHLIYEDNWQFQWQGEYTFERPVTIPAYSHVKVTCTFDNTVNNPNNPNNPIVAVSWGERTTDEMCLAFVGVTLDNDPFAMLNSIKPVR